MRASVFQSQLEELPTIHCRPVQPQESAAAVMSSTGTSQSRRGLASRSRSCGIAAATRWSATGRCARQAEPPPFEGEDEGYRPDELVWLSHLSEVVHRALGQLAAHQCSVFVTTRAQDRSYAAVPQLTDCKLGAAYSRLNRPAKSLGKLLGPQLR